MNPDCRSELLKLEELIDGKCSRAIPMSIALWDVKTIALYLKTSQRHVFDRVVTQPGFPKAIRIPTPKGGQAHPRWKALEVIAYVESFQK